MNTSPDRDFIENFVANIDDDLPRLVYADWLDEHNRPERAEFVRVQVERARLPHWDPAQVALRLREDELLKQHGEEWLSEMPTIPGARWEGFRRGVVAEVSFASFESMRKNAHTCRAVAPIEAVTVRWPRRREGNRSVKPIAELRELTLTGQPEYEAYGWVADSPQLATLRRLTARGVWSYADTLLASPHMGSLRSLCLPGNGLGNRGFRDIARAASLTSLEELDLSSMSRHERYSYDDVIRAESIRLLVNWPGLASLRTLNLSGNDLTQEGLRILLRSPHITALRDLTIRDCRLNGTAMAEFHSAAKTLNLETLDVGQNVLKDVGAEYLALAPCLANLKTLRIDRCEISMAGGELFGKKASYLSGIQVLDASHNHFGMQAVRAILARESSCLHSLDLGNNNLADSGAELLARSPAANTLLALDLSRNQLGHAAAQALSESSHLGNLIVLRVQQNQFGNAADELKQSQLGQRLSVLDLG